MNQPKVMIKILLKCDIYKEILESLPNLDNITDCYINHVARAVSDLWGYNLTYNGRFNGAVLDDIKEILIRSVSFPKYVDCSNSKAVVKYSKPFVVFELEEMAYNTRIR